MAGGWNDAGRSKRRDLASRVGRVRTEMTGVLRANIRNAARNFEARFQAAGRCKLWGVNVSAHVQRHRLLSTRGGQRRPSIIRPLWRSRTTSLNGDLGRRPATADVG